MIYETYESYLENVSEVQYNKFKEHLQTQYYKELERTSDVNERFLHEKIKTNLMYSDAEFICKFISELIKEIKISEGDLHIEYNFIYEVQNKILLYREYDNHILKVEFSEKHETLDEL